jgi:hypothetical protein
MGGRRLLVERTKKFCRDLSLGDNVEILTRDEETSNKDLNELFEACSVRLTRDHPSTPGIGNSLFCSFSPDDSAVICSEWRMDIDGKDELIASLPIHFSQSLHPRLHLHQFQLHTRPLEVPPTAAQAGKIIKARYKPAAGKYEIHVPTDVRPEVWNALAGQTYGAARYEEDKDEALMQDIKFKSKEPHELRLNETRLLSERVAHSGEYVLGVMRDGTNLCPLY